MSVQALLHQNQPYDESLEVPDAEEIASTYSPTPRVPNSSGETLSTPAVKQSHPACPLRSFWIVESPNCKQKEVIALHRQGTQQQRPESPTVTPPGMGVNTVTECAWNGGYKYIYIHISAPLGASFLGDVPLVEFIYLVLTRMPGRVTVGDSGLCYCVPCLLSTIISLCLGILRRSSRPQSVSDYVWFVAGFC